MKNCTNNSTSRALCFALVFYCFIVVSPGVATAGPLDKGFLNMEDEAVRDMQWRERVESPRTPTPRQVIPAPMQGPVVQQPDLSGLPVRLPQVTPETPPPVDAAQDRALTRPKLNDWVARNALLSGRVSAA